MVAAAAVQDPITSLRSLRWQGFSASLLITVSSWGVGWLPRNQLSPLARSGFFIEFRIETLGVITCILGMAVGIGWLFRSWLLTRPLVSSHESITRSQLAKLVTAWSLPLLASFPILSRDVFSYLAQGRMLHADKSPYFEGISALPGWFEGGSDGLWAQSPSPYGVLFLVLARLIFFVSNGIPEIGVGLLRVVAVAGVLGCYYATSALSEKLGHNARWAVWAIVANPLFLLTMIGGVHNDALMLAFTFLAFILALDRRMLLATLALSVAVSIKPIVLVLLPFLGLAMLGADTSLRARIAIWWRISVLSLFWLSVFGALTGLWFGWVPAMFTAGGAAFPYAPVGLLGTLLGYLAGILGGNPEIIRTIVFTLFRVAGIYLVARLALAKDATRPLRLAAWALSAVVVLAPIIQPWFILWLFALFFISNQVSWSSEKLMILLSALILIAVFIDQLSIEQWHSVWLFKVLAGVVSVGLVLLQLRFDSRVNLVLRGTRPDRVR